MRARILLILGLSWVATTPAGGQPLRRALPSGELTGLELGIEGPLTVRPGERAQWMLVAHEVVHDRDLRPAPGARIEALASFEPERALAEVRTDARGRATIAIDVPADLPSGFELVFDLRAEGARLSRRFRVPVTLGAGETLRLVALREAGPPGEHVPLVGTLTDALGRPLPGREVRLEVWQNERPVASPWTVVTDAEGRVLARVRAREGGLQVRATAVHGSGEARATIAIGVRPPPPRVLDLRAVARNSVVAPRAVVEVEVLARDARGRPLEGAEVLAPALDPGAEPDRALTDARGRARVRVRAPAREGEHQLELSAVVAGLSRANVSTVVRVSRGHPIVRAVVEGGALLLDLPSRVYVRVVDPDGRARVAAAVSLSIGEDTHESSTDTDGIAVFEHVVPSPDRAPLSAGENGCGGGTAMAAIVRVDQHRERLCLPTDPDGVVRVRAQPVDGALEVAARRRADLGDLPVALSLLARRPSGLVPVYATVLEPGAETLRVPFPQNENGSLVIRARALATDALVEVRGSMTLVERERVLGALRGNLTAGRPLLAVAAPADADLPALALQGPAARAARRAAATPFDDAAPAVWHDGRPTFLASPDEPTTRGVLRDPWRQRAVYRSGRLALVLRAIEAEVEAASGEGELRDVAHRLGGRWQLNRAVLERAISSQTLGAEGARDLGGIPLTLEQLEAADPAFRFDTIAGRITRARLLRVLVALRRLVQSRGLDLVFARRGEVTTWLTSLLDEGDLEPSDLRDGWGHPLALRPSARPRFGLFTPVAGYELVAPGPDGTLGTRDDRWDPLARVLPSGGLYAEAIDEDGLLLRLREVSLAHATLAQLGEIHEEVASSSESASALPGWDDVPRALSIPALDPRPFAPRTHVQIVPPGSDLARLLLPSYPARYSVVFYDGETPVAVVSHERGGGALFVGELPTRLPDAPLELPLPFVPLEGLEGLRVELAAQGADVRVVAAPSNATSPGALSTWTALVHARTAGHLDLRLVDAAGTVHARRSVDFDVVGAGAPRDRRAAALVDASNPWQLGFELPADAGHPQAEVVVLAPRLWHRDPAFLERPALVAWSEVLIGGTPDETVLRRLDHLVDPLERACASVVASALDDPRRRIPLPSATGDLVQDAALLAALAPAAPPPWHTEDDVFARLRRNLRAAPVTHADNLPVLARAAAALLLADARDESGRALLERALALHETTDVADARDALATAAALALALHRLGDDRARSFLVAAARRAWLLFERVDDATFWWLAASAYGVAGESAELVGATFEEGVARLSPDPRQPLTVATRGEGLALARFRARFERPVPDLEDAFALSVEGHLGRRDRPAALELVVEAHRASAAPRLLVRVPAAAQVDDAARSALAAAEGVLRVEPAHGGALLVHLRPLASGETRRLPLRLRWLAAGRRPGVALAAWDATTPWQTSSRAPEPWDID